MVAAWDIDQTEGADAAWQCCGSLCLYRPCLACVFANTDGSPNIQCMDTTVTIPVQLGPIRITSMALVSRTGNGRFWPIPNSPPAPRRPLASAAWTHEFQVGTDNQVPTYKLSVPTYVLLLFSKMPTKVPTFPPEMPT